MKIKFRDFIKNDLNLPEKENVEIELAGIIDRAKTQIPRDSNISVNPDYTDRVV